MTTNPDGSTADALVRGGPGRGGSLRDRTREEIYRLILGSPGVSRTELAHLTGMSRSAVAHAVARLIGQGRVAESDPGSGGPGSGSGRPASRLTALAVGGPVAGLDFGHNHLWVGLADALGQPVADGRIPMDVDLNATQAMDEAAAQLARLMKHADVPKVTAVVAGIPGPVDRRTGLVTSPTILSSWVGLAPAQELGRRIGMDVHIENDAVLGANGELHSGAGRSHRDFLYVKASHGIGAALILNGRAYTGATGIAGEIGHTRLSNNTELCRCGDRGCLEAVVSVQAVRQQLRHTHPDVDGPDLGLSEFDDPIAQRIFREAGRTIGEVLAGSCNLFNPSAVIIGGELGAASPALIDGARAAILGTAQPATAEAVEVLAAELGFRAELTGALQLASILARR